MLFFPPTSSLLLCILLHDSLLCVLTFGCHSWTSQFSTSLAIYLPLLIPSRWLFLFCTNCSPVTCSFSSLKPTRACLSQVWVSYFDSPPLLFAPPPLFLLFIYIGRAGVRCCQHGLMYGERGHGWGDLGVWWTLLSVRILKNWLVRYCKKVLLW